MKTKKLLQSLEGMLETHIARKHNKSTQRGKPYGVVYTRVSSQEQAENNSSLETQLKLCADCAKRKELSVKKYFGGTYESAKTDERKEFQEMLSYVRKDKDISCIIVYNYDRFSRTGPLAAMLSSELAKIGIRIISATQELDSFTPSGKFQENLFHLFNNYDNQQRASRTSTNTREVMLKGYWPYLAPLGYQNLKPKHRACDHHFIITDEGKWLKRAFQWKAEGLLTNKEIIDKLSARGVRLTEKNFRWIISNPFYVGYVTGKLVDGKLVQGKHPPLIDLQTFLIANNLLNTEPTAGIAKTHRIEELPLKIFAKDEVSACPLTGYIKKGHWYYKTRNSSGKVNVSAIRLNEHFKKLLNQFEFKNLYKEKLKKALSRKLTERLKNAITDNVQLKKRLTELENLLEGIEERYVVGELKVEMYEKYSAKYQVEIGKIRQELTTCSFDSSNLNLIVEKGLKIAQNLGQLWVLGDFSAKQKLQYLVFPRGILYNKEKDTVRTEKINILFAGIPLLTRVSEKNKKGNFEKNCLKSWSVPEIGIEPIHSCERQILSLLRLPIPPPGLLVKKK